MDNFDPNPNLIFPDPFTRSTHCWLSMLSTIRTSFVTMGHLMTENFDVSIDSDKVI